MKRRYRIVLRTLSLFLVACIITPLFSFSSSAKYFSDLFRGMLPQEFMDAMNYVSDNGWINGVSSTEFDPYGEVTRGMFATILYRYSASNERYAPNFDDVPSSAYYYYPIGWAAHYGIVGGVSSTSFEPDAFITKEQMITILYRYSKLYEGITYNTYQFSIISQYPDYSSVSQYAREPMRWAKTYCVLSSNVDSTYLNPQTTMNRAYASLYLANYSKNAGLWRGQDRFSFTHSSSSFHSDNYYMNTSTQRYLFECIDNYYAAHPEITNNASQEKQRIEIELAKDWSGSCFGLSTCLYLDKIGGIDFNKNIAGNKSTMSQVPAPINNQYVESAINFYHILQYTEVYNANRVTYNETNNANGVESMYNYVKEHGAVLFTYGYIKNGNRLGHSVIVRHITKSVSSSKTTYTLSVVDVNYSDRANITLEVEAGSVAIDNATMTWFSYSKVSYSDELLGFDLDGYMNNVRMEVVTRHLESEENSVGYSRESSDLVEDSAEFAFFSSLYTDLFFRSSSGESLLIGATGLSGTADISTMNYSCNGENSPANFSIDVSLADEYEYVNHSDKPTSIAFGTSSGYACVSGCGIERVVFHRDTRCLEVYGSDMTYKISLCAVDENNITYCLSGTSSSDFTVSADNGTIVTTGVTGIQRHGFSSSETIYPVMTEVEFPLAEPTIIPNAANIYAEYQQKESLR